MQNLILFTINLLGIYLMVGGLFSILFLWKGLVEIDEAAQGTGFWFRALLFPGITVFWIIFFYKWLRIRRP